MDKNTIVQILSKGILDKSLNGVIGFVLSTNSTSAKVNIYYPKELGKNAFVVSKDIPLDNLYVIGEPKLKPL